MSAWFESIAGYSSVKKRLARMVDTERVAQTLLFYGEEKAPKKQFALAFAQMLLKSKRPEHPDLHFYYPEGKIGLHSIASMRQFCDTVFLAPFEASKKVFIIMEADRMLPTSANALLKTFEEPAKDSVIILVSARPSQIIPTILSRCQKVQIELSPEARQEKDSLLQLLLSSLSEAMLSSYSSILQVVDDIAKSLDEEAIVLENSLSEELLKKKSVQLTALQKELIKKEIDGTVALQKKTRIKHLFIGLLSWYRDLYLLKVNGNCKFLMNPAFKEQLLQSSKVKNLPSLSKIERAIQETLIALERTTSAKICFENLFLRLMEYHCV